MTTYLIVGLGNPGEEYEETRHNIGRDAVVFTARRLGAPDFDPQPKWKALTAAAKSSKSQLFLLLPETFMNKSGAAVAEALRTLKIKPDRLIVVHDDVDLLLGSTKLSYGKNSGGHKGVESVMRAVKTKKFWRLRIGVQKKRRVPGEDLVLQKLRGEDSVIAKKMVAKTLKAVEIIAALGPERAMNAYNQ